MVALLYGLWVPVILISGSDALSLGLCSMMHQVRFWLPHGVFSDSLRIWYCWIVLLAFAFYSSLLSFLCFNHFCCRGCFDLTRDLFFRPFYWKSCRRLCLLMYHRYHLLLLWCRHFTVQIANYIIEVEWLLADPEGIWGFLHFCLNGAYINKCFKIFKFWKYSLCEGSLIRIWLLIILRIRNKINVFFTESKLYEK